MHGPSDAPIIGTSVLRQDAYAKVTGAARYASDCVTPMLHGVLVTSTIARGSIADIDRAMACAFPGVAAVLTHLDFSPADFGARRPWHVMQTEPRPILHSPEIRHFGQVVAIIVADSPEAARHAATLVDIRYTEAPARLKFTDDAVERTRFIGDFIPADSHKGHFQKAFAEADVALDESYSTPIAHAQPMEPHACVAHWDAAEGALTLDETTQAPSLVRSVIARTLKLRSEKVRIVSPYVGGGFGSKTMVHPHTIAAALATRHLNRPVRVVMTRVQLFALTSHRSGTLQRLRLGATPDGGLTAIGHDALAHTAMGGGWVEPTAIFTRAMYAAPNRQTRHRRVRRDIISPSVARAPGEAPGSFALESAMDELAHRLELDPIELRRRNEPHLHPEKGKVFTSRSLLACLDEGARRFGWKAPPRVENGLHIGMGVAAASYPAYTLWSRARATLGSDGRVCIEIAASDIGTGTYTILTQIAAETLGLPIQYIDVRLGDTAFPTATPSGGSSGAATFGSAVMDAAHKLRKKLDRLRQRHGDLSPVELIRAAGGWPLVARGVTYPPILTALRYASSSHGAQFAEVSVNRATGEVRVRRMLGVFAAGRILNPRTARSQLIGGMIWGMGQALMEHSDLDERDGHFVNADFGGYHFPACPDATHVEAVTLTEEDKQVNRLGVKGVGELGMVGAAAAIANAVFDATGVRMRHLPLTPQHFIEAEAKIAPSVLRSDTW